MIKLAAFQTSDGARMKLRLAGTVNRLNVEHRTLNIDELVESQNFDFYSL